MQVKNVDWLALPDLPLAPAGLAEGVPRISSLTENQAEVADQIHASFDDS